MLSGTSWMEGALSQVVEGEGRTACLPWWQAPVYRVAKSWTRLSTHEEWGKLPSVGGRRSLRPDLGDITVSSGIRYDCYKSLWHLSVIAYGCPRGRCDLEWTRYSRCLQLSYQNLQRRLWVEVLLPGVPSFLGWRSYPRGSQQLRKTFSLPEAGCEQSTAASSSFRKWFQSRTFILWSWHC